jgi:hypothetical protein
MESDYIAEMLNAIALYPYGAAYASNAIVVDECGMPLHNSFASIGPYIVVKTAHELASRYFSRYPNGIAPFPGYVFRSSVVKDIPIDPQCGGKYSDVTWLIEIIKRRHFVWVARTLIRYRIHSGSDGVSESLGDRLRLLGYLKSNSSVVGKDSVADYRFFLYKKICKSQVRRRHHSQKLMHLAEAYMFRYRIQRLFRGNTYAYFWFKITSRLRMS